ncbi:MAG: type I 3-dehydroquinate dehydratase [Fibrobacter sp.]|jgi:3-dehydroquinate dehydratase-1|nr:type I 3-dehydroquinate dehydratase [Fibrobacter sp.]
MTKIGNFELGIKPGIVAIIDEMISVEEITALKGKGIDLIELRIDCFDAPLEETVSYVKKIRSSIDIPSIGTVRETDFNKNNRLEFFQAIAPFVDCVDIELGTPISKEILACSKGKTILVSEHDFEKTPSIDALQSMVDRALLQGADIIKIAVMARSTADVTRLLRFTEDCKVPLVTIAMGPLGSVSRVIAPLFGSLFTYGFIHRPVAPGQLSVEKLIEERTLYFPAGID